MPRILIATIAGLAFLVAYLFAALALGDVVLGLHWTLQAVFFLLAGTLWTMPIKWLMFWSVRKT